MTADKPKSDNSSLGGFLFIYFKKTITEGVSNGCGQRQNLCIKPVGKCGNK